ncbi:MAG: ATP synthase F1 subunit gamma [bacterium]
MPSLKQIRRRIMAVRNIAQVTRAMKMVAAAKLKRAQQNMERARPYARMLMEAMEELASRSSPDLHPLLAVRDPQRIGIVAVTSDRGLCGAFNANICRRTQEVLEEFRGRDVELFTIGRKGHEFFRKRGVSIYRYFPGVFKDLKFSQAIAIGSQLRDVYISERFDRIYLVYNEFKNPLQQRIVCQQLLPITPRPLLTVARGVDWIFEPDPIEVLNQILPLYINIEIWQVMLESFAAEQGARMSAMESATENANELIKSLTLEYNKARQTAITKELLEIVGGAEGLKGR